MSASFTSYTHKPAAGFSNDFPVESEAKTLLAGTDYAKWSILGLITTGANAGKLTLADPAAVDGSEDIYGYLADDVDATSADATGTVNTSGDISADAVVFKPAGYTAVTAEANLRLKRTPIWIKTLARIV
jgi:hypothetical protein